MLRFAFIIFISFYFCSMPLTLAVDEFILYLEELANPSHNFEFIASKLKERRIIDPVVESENILSILIRSILPSKIEGSLSADNHKRFNAALVRILDDTNKNYVCKNIDEREQSLLDIAVDNLAYFDAAVVEKIIANSMDVSKYHPELALDRSRSSSRSSVSLFGAAASSQERKEWSLSDLVVMRYIENSMLKIKPVEVLSFLSSKDGVLDASSREVGDKLFGEFAVEQNIPQALFKFSLINKKDVTLFFNFIKYYQSLDDQEKVSPKITKLQKVWSDFFDDAIKTGTINEMHDREGNSLPALLLRHGKDFSIAEDFWNKLKASDNLAKISPELFLISSSQGSFLHEIIKANNSALLKNFCEKMHSVDLSLKAKILSQEDEQRNMPLHTACKKGWDCAIKNLVSLGASLEALNLKGKTPLLLAVENDFSESCQLLCRLAADVESSAAAVRPLYVATQRNSETAMRILLENGANPNAKSTVAVRGGVIEISALEQAVKNNNTKAVGMLLQYGANVRDERGEYLPYYAEYKSQIQPAEALRFTGLEFVGDVMRQAKQDGRFINLVSAFRIAKPRILLENKKLSECIFEAQKILERDAVTIEALKPKQQDIFRSMQDAIKSSTSFSDGQKHLANINEFASVCEVFNRLGDEIKLKGEMMKAMKEGDYCKAGELYDAANPPPPTAAHPSSSGFFVPSTERTF